ncbi:MAG TPA: nuclear transport factor 2 family protein [Gemmatimonadaceae bacterium]
MPNLVHHIAGASLFAAVAIPTRAAAQPPRSCNSADPTTARAAVYKARDRVWRAWFGGDTATLRSVLASDLMTIDGGARDWQGLDAALLGSAAFAASGSRLASIEFPRSRIQHVGNVVVVFSTYRLSLETKMGRTTQTGRASEVFVCRRGVWLNSSWHLSDQPSS